MWEYLLPLFREGLAKIHQETAHNWTECINHCMVRGRRYRAGLIIACGAHHYTYKYTYFMYITLRNRLSAHCLLICNTDPIYTSKKCFIELFAI